MCTHSVLREDNQGPGCDAAGERLLLACLGGLKVQRGPILSSSGTVSGESHGEWGVLEDRHWARCGVVVGAGPGPVSGRRDDWLGLLQFPQSEPLPVHLPYFPSPHLSQPVGTDSPCYNQQPQVDLRHFCYVLGKNSDNTTVS